MPKSYEEISNSIANQNGKTDANLANDALHLGGIPAEEYATKEWVKEYHGGKESSLLNYINEQDEATLNTAKEYANTLVRNQDFSDFAKLSDVQTLNKNLTEKINTDIAAQKKYTDTKTDAIVKDVNSNFQDVGNAIDQLNDNMSDLFQSVSNGKAQIAEAITDKGVTTSANASFDTMASNIREIDTNQGMIVIPDGYMDTSDATAGPGQVLQGYTAYANGNKIHGTYIPTGGGSTGGVILGDDEVVASKVYGEAGVLAGGKLNVATGIGLSNNNISSKSTLVCTTNNGDYIVANRQMSEGINNEIIIYNVSSTQVLYHKDINSKFSYTLTELGIQGNINCIAASPLEYLTDIVQITVGTTVGVYTFLFDATLNNENGGFAENTIFGNKKNITINTACASYNGICYSNTDPNTFAFCGGGKIYIVKALFNIEQDIIVYTEVDALLGVDGLFRFNASDTFLAYAPWGITGGTYKIEVILLQNFTFVTQQEISEQVGSGRVDGQFLVNSQNNFAIISGKPYQVTFDYKSKNLSFTKMSDTLIIPYNSGLNESLYACFSSDDKYVYAIDFNTHGLLGCFKVEYANLNSQWVNVSEPLPVPPNSNGTVPPSIDIVNKKVVGFITITNDLGFYYYKSDPNVKALIGLNYNGNLYKRA